MNSFFDMYMHIQLIIILFLFNVLFLGGLHLY